MGDEQDLRKMGGLRKKLPVTFWTMTIAVFTIAGFPPFAGFFSKDAILYAAFVQGPASKALWFVGLLTALLTSFYMFRLWYLTFLGKPRSEASEHVHATPWTIGLPLVILALLSICGGWIWLFGFPEFLAPVLGPRVEDKSGIPNLELILSAIAVLVALEGLVLANKYYKRKPERPAQLAANHPGGYNLLVNKYYVDEFYGATVVKPLLATSTYLLGWVVDTALIGGAAWLLGGIATFSGALLQRWQSGNIRSYAAWLAAGAAALLLFVVVPWADVLSNLGIHLNMAGH
jgi:NADH-quinone oxidoreductase subunit L